MANAAITNCKLIRSKAADQTITSSTTLTDITDLTFAIKANQKWKVKAGIFLQIESANSQGKVAFNGPASPTSVRLWQSVVESGAPGTLISSAALTESAYNTGTTLWQGVAVGFVGYEGVVENGANDGTFSFQFAQVSSHADDTTVKRGSWIEAELLP